MRRKKVVKEMNPFKNWGDKINWSKRVKAVCKPCWEIKYCPYGPLVEDFPLEINSDERSCRVFGHQCPVFFVAEPLTETKKLRNISRQIPRVTQFRVLKRENQICSCCGKSVKDDEIEFDHIIPRSKGGSSDESNVRLLCLSCNRKKGKKFEEDYLIESVSDHIREQTEIQIVLPLASSIQIFHDIFKITNKLPSPFDVCKYFGRRKVQFEDEKAIEVIKDIVDFFNSKKPLEIKPDIFKALKYRWGFLDSKFHIVEDVIKKFNITEDELLIVEISLLSRLGWYIKITPKTRKIWLKQEKDMAILINN